MQSKAHRDLIPTQWLAAVIAVALVALSLCPAQAQTPTLERLKEALALERKPDLPAAEAIYRGLVNDPNWAAAARLSLARVQRWQSLHESAISHYESVLIHPLATQGMKDEANLGLAQIDALETRLAQALQRLDSIHQDSPTKDQVNKLRAEVLATHPTRIGASYGQVHNKGGSTDSSWQLRMTHQIDMRNVVTLGYASNSLQPRSAQPDAALDFVKGQWQASWRYKMPLGAGLKPRIGNSISDLMKPVCAHKFHGQFQRTGAPQQPFKT
jgi:hypothetical protein